MFPRKCISRTLFAHNLNRTLCRMLSSAAAAPSSASPSSPSSSASLTCGSLTRFAAAQPTPCSVTSFPTRGSPPAPSPLHLTSPPAQSQRSMPLSSMSSKSMLSLSPFLSPADKIIAACNAREIVELCAVPKKRVSIRRRRVRRHGQRMKNIKKEIVSYKICYQCGNPYKLHHMCGTCKTFDRQYLRANQIGEDGQPVIKTVTEYKFG